MQYWVVMPAAGSGQRFGGDVPKQYALLAGHPLIEWSLRPFLGDTRCRGVMVVLAAADARWHAVAAAFDGARLMCTTGGAERCDSVLRGLAALPAADDDWVLVHDAARPCVSRAEIDALLAAGAAHPAGALLAVPLADTLKRADPAGCVAQTVPRAGLWRALTPQMSRRGALRAALLAAQAAGMVPTDEAQALEQQGLVPRLVAGSALNIKVTTPADLEFAAAVLRSRGEQS